MKSVHGRQIELLQLIWNIFEPKFSGLGFPFGVLAISTIYSHYSGVAILSRGVGSKVILYAMRKIILTSK